MRYFCINIMDQFSFHLMLILKKFEPVYSTASFYDKLSYSYFEKLKTFSPGGWILIGSLSIYLNKTFVYVFPIYFEIFFLFCHLE